MGGSARIEEADILFGYQRRVGRGLSIAKCGCYLCAGTSIAWPHASCGSTHPRLR